MKHVKKAYEHQYQSPSAGQVAKGTGMAVGVPLAIQLGMQSTMGDAMTTMPNPHQAGQPDMPMYRPTAEATKRVAERRGSMLDHMRAYRDPTQVQNHPAYAVANHFGPTALREGTAGLDKMLGNGVATGALSGAGVGAGAGILSNALMAFLGRSQFNPLKSGLWGAGIGAGVGGGAAKYRDWRTDQLSGQKAAAWRGPGMDRGAAQAELQGILAMIRSAPGLSFYQRGQLMSGVSSLSPGALSQLRGMLGMGGGALAGATVARFLMGKGLVSTVIGAVTGGVLGNAIFGRRDNSPRNFMGQRGLRDVDVAGNRF